VASRLAARFGLVRTMVFTHLPSNVLLILVPFMPSLQLAVAVLFARFSISQMDVPTRQSYLMAVVSPEERSAAGGITGVARTIGAGLAPMFAGLLFAQPAWINAPFFIAGALKIVYDLALYRSFVRNPYFRLMSTLSNAARSPRASLSASPSPQKVHEQESRGLVQHVAVQRSHRD